jgi:hypothetical protein
MKKIAVVGFRNFTDYELLKKTLDDSYDKPWILISGGAKGADTLAEQYADEKGYEKIIHLPDKKKYGRGAYHRRNQLIVDDADEMISFLLGESKGTKHSLELAKRKGIPVTIIKVLEKESNDE